MVALPLELYRPIIEKVPDKASLCAIARSSSALQPEAERLIYRAVSVHGPAGIVGLCQRIRFAPRVGAYVISFLIDDFRLSMELQAYQPLLLSTLERMSNLEHLGMYLQFPLKYPDLISYIKSKLISIRFGTGFPYDEGLSLFLASQPTIRRVELFRNPYNRIPYSMPSYILPNLRAIVTNASNIASEFLRDRPVTHLSVHHILPSDSLDMLASSSESITTLSITNCPMEILSLPSVFPSIRCLSGIRVYRSEEMDDYLLIISELSQLREIDVSIHIFHREGNLTAIKASYVQRMTIARPTLRTIVLSIPMDYTHWVRHEKENMWSRMDGPIPSLWERSVAQIDLAGDF